MQGINGEFLVSVTEHATGILNAQLWVYTENISSWSITE